MLGTYVGVLAIAAFGMILTYWVVNRLDRALKNFIKAVARFVAAFEAVFDDDWEYTRERLMDDWPISEGCTFLQPGVPDEAMNWANRGQLLEAYRELAALLGPRERRS